MTPLKNAAHFVSSYLPQIFMVLVLIAAFTMAKLPAQETSTNTPIKSHLQSPKTANL